jgi:hypothetical protein
MLTKTLSAPIAVDAKEKTHLLFKHACLSAYAFEDSTQMFSFNSPFAQLCCNG